MNFASARRMIGSKIGEKTPPCASCELPHCRLREFAPSQSIALVHRLERGQCLESKDGACLRFWVTLDGTAATSTTFRDGRRQILSIEHPGDAICGAMATQESEQRLEALTDCKICELDLSPFAEDLRHDPDFLAGVTRMMHARLEQMTTHLSTLGRLDSHERVTYFLAEMAARQSDTQSIVTLPMSREDIADYLGLNTDSVSRILSRIRKSGVVRFLSPTEYTVPDMEAVARRLPLAVPHPPHHAIETGGHIS